MGNDLCCSERSKWRALDERPPARQTEKKARGIEIACSRRIDEFLDLLRFDHVKLVSVCHDASRFRSRQHGELDLFSYQLQRFVEEPGFIERGKLFFIGEENIDVPRDQLL